MDFDALVAKPQNARYIAMYYADVLCRCTLQAIRTLLLESYYPHIPLCVGAAVHNEREKARVP
jgi:hypothetical protein